jgi:hypothetical protein
MQKRFVKVRINKYIMSRSKYYRERKFEILNSKPGLLSKSKGIDRTEAEKTVKGLSTLYSVIINMEGFVNTPEELEW